MSENILFTAEKELPRSEVVRHIRKTFGVTQAQLAAAMGTSVKTIQSYEQGWRKVPTRALVQLLVLLAVHRRREVDMEPCWAIRNCAPEIRQDCANNSIGDGQFCWFVSAGKCCPRPEPKSDSDESLLPCMECEVIRRLLRGHDSEDEGQNDSTDTGAA